MSPVKMGGCRPRADSRRHHRYAHRILLEERNVRDDRARRGRRARLGDIAQRVAHGTAVRVHGNETQRDARIHRLGALSAVRTVRRRRDRSFSHF